MTIVSGPDSRNEQWASDKSAFGQRMLKKMGWTEGKGLGKNQQGTNTNLRAIRREEGLGIGAKTDTFGDDGFSKTSKNFHGVLATLQAEHREGNKSGKKSKKNKKKKKETSKELQNNDSSSSLTLSQKRVTAGHAKKMRKSKDLTTKSKEDMAAIFGMKVEDYQSNSVWGKLSSLGQTLTSSTDNEKDDQNTAVSSSDTPIREIEDKKRRKAKKKRKRVDKDDDNNHSFVKGKKKKKKSKNKDKL